MSKLHLFTNIQLLGRYAVLLFAFLLLTQCQTALKKRNILVIGDSNGADAKGWVFQFQQLRKGGPVVNTAIGGNTVGFDGMGSNKLNTIEQLSTYLRRAYAEMGGIDEVIIGLGTNDCKQQYIGLDAERHVNYRRLLDELILFFQDRGQEVPRIVLLSPPAAGDNKIVSEEFQGVASCVAEMAIFLQELAETKGYCYVNLLEKPGASLLQHSSDGIHFNATGHELIARQLLKKCY